MVLGGLNDQQHSVDEPADDRSVRGGHNGWAVDQDLVVMRFGPGDQVSESFVAEQFHRIGRFGAAGQHVEIFDSG